MELELLKKNMELNYYKNLLKALKKSKLDYHFLYDLIKKINNETEKIYLSETEKTETENNETLIYSEDYLYKKPWTKLSEVHKIIKLREFVNKLLIENDDKKKQLKIKLKQLVKKKVLTRKNTVKYDSNKGRVISIPSLIYQNGEYLID